MFKLFFFLIFLVPNLLNSAVVSNTPFGKWTAIKQVDDFDDTVDLLSFTLGTDNSKIIIWFDNKGNKNSMQIDFAYNYICGNENVEDQVSLRLRVDDNKVIDRNFRLSADKNSVYRSLKYEKTLNELIEQMKAGKYLKVRVIDEICGKTNDYTFNLNGFTASINHWGSGKDNQEIDISKKEEINVDFVGRELLNNAKSSLANLENEKSIQTLLMIVDSKTEDKELLAETYYLLGRTYFIEDNFLEAIKYFGLRHKEYPDISRFKAINYFYLAKSLKEINDLKNACAITDDLINLDEFLDSPKIIAEAQIFQLELNCGGEPAELKNIKEKENLTQAEINTLIAQIRSCLVVPAGFEPDLTKKITVNVSLSKNGYVKTYRVNDYASIKNEKTRLMADIAQRAFGNPNCEYLNLPEDKYDIWKEMNITIDFNWLN